MKGVVDLKSLGIGVLLGVCIMIGRGQTPAPAAPFPSDQLQLSQRYQFSVHSTRDGSPEIFLLDKHRKVIEIFYLGGQDWKKTKPTFDIEKHVEQP